MGRRVGAVRGGLVYRYLYGAGDTVLAEKVGNEWVYYGYGGAMDQSVSGSEVAYQYWNYRGDLVSQSPAWGERVPAPITDAFGDLVAGVGCVWGAGLGVVGRRRGRPRGWGRRRRRDSRRC